MLHVPTLLFAQSRRSLAVLAAGKFKVAAKAEEHKKRKYSDIISSHFFVPIAIETTVVFGAHAHFSFCQKPWSKTPPPIWRHQVNLLPFSALDNLKLVNYLKLVPLTGAMKSIHSPKLLNGAKLSLRSLAATVMLHWRIIIADNICKVYILC